jgi:Cellulose synthase subunit D
VGVRFAHNLALPGCESLGELEAAMNRIWDALEWGSVGIAESGRMLRIVHSAYPIIDAEGDAATLVLGCVLQGVYTHWLNSQGGDPQFRARFASPGAHPPSPLCFEYGRHGAAS